MAVIEQDPVRYGMQSLRLDAAIDRVWQFNATGSVWTDETTDANSTATADVPLTTAVGSELYLCHDEPFAYAYIDMSTNASGGTRVLEYWNGAAWVTLTATFISGGVLLNADSSVGWNIPSDWATVAVNGDPARYAIRWRTTVAHTTAGTISRIGIAPLQRVANAKTIRLGSTTGRAFREVVLQVEVSHASLGACERILARCRLGGGAWTDAITATVAMWTPVESHQAVLFADVTALFTADFGAGASQTFDLEVCYGSQTASGNGASAYAAARLVINYDSDDADAEQMGSIEIPYTSILSSLSTSLLTLGTMPDLSAFLPETGVTVRDIWIDFNANADEQGTNDWNFVVRADAESEVTLAQFDGANQSDFALALRWSRPDLAANATHTIDARVTNVTGAQMAHCGIKIGVTYSYTGGTRRMRHRRIPFRLNDGTMKGTAATDAAQAEVEFWTPEKLPTLEQSAITLFVHQANDPGAYRIVCGGGTERSYTTNPTVTAGCQPIQHRFDGSAEQGSGITFARGKNVLTVRGYGNTNPEFGGGEYGIIDLLYTYEVESGKRLVPFELLTGFGNETMSASFRRTGTFSLAIGPTNYWLSDIGVFSTQNDNSSTGATWTISLERDANAGWHMEQFGLNTDSNLGWRAAAAQLVGLFKRHPADPVAGRSDIETSRNFVLTSGISGFGRTAVLVMGAWHNYTWSSDLDIDQSDGGLVSVTVQDDDGVPYLETSRTGDGLVTVTGYDDTSDYRALCEESTTHRGLTKAFNFGDA